MTLPAHPTQSTAAGQDPSWGNLISFMENGGAASSAPARSLVTKVKYKAAEHAQQLALSRADRDAEKEAMKMAEKRAMGVHHLTAREAAANVLGSMSHDTMSDASMSDDSDQSLGATVAHNPTAAADSAIGGKDDDSSALDDAHSDGNHSHKSLLTVPFCVKERMVFFLFFQAPPGGLGRGHTRAEVIQELHQIPLCVLTTSFVLESGNLLSFFRTALFQCVLAYMHICASGIISV